eukprot:jgi/Chrzof1/5248/Cz15g18210.t1
MSLPCSMAFNAPVPSDVVGYADVITVPMDLGTIRHRLQQGQYSNTNKIVMDVALIWANCRKFNAAGSAIVKVAAKAENAFKQAWADAGLVS